MAVLATIGVYGIVALIVRMDDAGYCLISLGRNKGFSGVAGRTLVKGLPLVIKLLAVVGTFALILVSGGIFTHHLEFSHYLLPNLPAIVREFLAGLVAGLFITAGVTGVKKIAHSLRS